MTIQKHSYCLYAVTDVKLSGGLSHQVQAELCFRGGCDALQLRDKTMGEYEMMRVAKDIVKIRDFVFEESKRRMKSDEFTGGSSYMQKPLFFVNDNVKVAIDSGADGVHLGQDDLRKTEIKDVRNSASEDFLIGVSVGNVKEAKYALSMGADYVALSPVFDTLSKSDAGCGNGLGVLTEIVNSLPSGYPVLAIGGINLQNAKLVMNAGACGCAVISAVVSQQNISKAVNNLRHVICDD